MNDMTHVNAVRHMRIAQTALSELRSCDGRMSSMILWRNTEVLRVAAIKAADPARTRHISFL